MEKRLNSGSLLDDDLQTAINNEKEIDESF